MKTATKTKPAEIEYIDDGSWLRENLAGVRREVAKQPTPEAIGRMRGRLMAQLKRPTQAAA